MISSERTMVAELDTEEHLGGNLLIFNSHLSCCSNNDLRQDQVDEFSGSWRDWMLNGDGPFQIEIEFFKKGQRAETPAEAEELEPSRQTKRRRMGRRTNNGVDNSKVDWNATLMHLRGGFSRSECIRLLAGRFPCQCCD